MTENTKYLTTIPNADAPGYHTANNVATGWHGGCSPNFSNGDDFNNRGWGYCATPSDVLWGTIVVNCTHTDSKGSVWTSY